MGPSRYMFLSRPASPFPSRWRGDFSALRTTARPIYDKTEHRAARCISRRLRADERKPGPRCPEMEARFPANYSILLSGPPGVGKFEYLVARIREDLRSGERVVFVTLDMPPNEIRARAKALHLDLDMAEGKTFVFVDCYSATSSERPESAPGKKTILVSSFCNREGIGMAMSER